MFRPIEVHIGLRYTKARRRNHFISIFSLISIVGIMLGVLVMITVLSVMNGFQKEVRERILGAASHITIKGIDGSVDDWPEIMASTAKHPQVVGIVQDYSLIEMVPVLDGLKPDGLLLVNSEKPPEDLKLKTTATVETIAATEIAIEIIGRPIPNAIMIGAFCSITGLVSLEAVQEAIMARFPGKVGENNVAALERAHEIMQKR